MNVTVKSPASCPFCGTQNAVRSGLRKTRTGIKQVFRCKTCFRRFSGDSPTACRTPPHVIRRALALVCQDYTYDEALHFIVAHLRIRVSKSAISKWVANFNPPYLAIRKMNAGHRPIVRAHLFTHRGLNYNFQVHQPKLRFCRREGLTRYLGWIAEHLDAEAFEQGPRCSQLRLARNPGLYHAKNTPLNRLAADARRLAATNRDRHPALEEYFLCCDRNTVAVEVPVVCRHPEAGTVAGHIDILQINRGQLFILDYKPGAAKENPAKVVTQLTLYAAALVQSAGLDWDELRCAYFDEQDYYSFRPSPDLVGLPLPALRPVVSSPRPQAHPMILVDAEGSGDAVKLPSCVREHRSSYLDEDDARHPHYRQPRRWTAPDTGRVRASGASARTDTPGAAAVSRPETRTGTRQGNTP